MLTSDPARASPQRAAKHNLGRVDVVVGEVCQSGEKAWGEERWERSRASVNSITIHTYTQSLCIKNKQSAVYFKKCYTILGYILYKRQGMGYRFLETLPPQSFVHSTCSIPSAPIRIPRNGKKRRKIYANAPEIFMNLVVKLQCFVAHLELLDELDPLLGGERLGPVRSHVSSLIREGRVSRSAPRVQRATLTSQWGHQQHGR